MTRPVPDELWQFCQMMNQDIEMWGPTLDDGIRGALGYVQGRRHKQLRDYIDVLLRTKTDLELREIYDSTEREVGFNDVRAFFTLVRNIIDSEPPARFGLTADEWSRR